jgi:hypothetical protein
MDTVKHICIAEKTTTVNTTPSKPPPKKRVVTTSKKWDFQTADLTLEYQIALLQTCFSSIDSPTDPRCLFLEQLIHSKWYGYKTQDNIKQLFDPEKFVTERAISDLLVHSRLQCFYCLKPIQLFYEYVRETSQWTLERIDNAMGHNCDNVVIACLGCNIRRKTMYYERFVMTKQMTITKIDK